MGEIERQNREPEGLDYVKVSLGLVFVFGAFVFGILAPPGAGGLLRPDDPRCRAWPAPCKKPTNGDVRSR